MTKKTKFLLDTHILLWWLADHPNLPKQVRNIINSRKNIICVSAISAWEIGIKQSIGKLTIPKKPSIDRVIAQSGFIEIPITIEHALAAGKLPLLHKDPFDRMLIAQSNIEQLVLITNDTKIEQYDVEVVGE